MTVPPQILVNSKNNTRVSDELVIDYTIQEENLAQDKTMILLPDGTTIQNKTHVEISTANYTDGRYNVVISAQDKAENSDLKTITFDVGMVKTAPSVASPVASGSKIDSNFVLLAIIGAAAIGGASVVAFAAKKSKKH